MSRVQQTLKNKVSFSGIGVHSGLACSVTVWPAERDTGIVFRNAGCGSQKIVIGTVVPEAAMHATVIKSESWFVSTIEHLMASLYALHVDNAVVEVDGVEIPILDGSALIFVHEMLAAGIDSVGGEVLYLTPRHTLTLTDSTGRSINIVPFEKENLVAGQDPNLTVAYSAGFEHPLTGPTSWQGRIDPDVFVTQIAPARTFGFLEQLPMLRKHQLAQGSSVSNTVVIGSEPINEVRFPDECVRHKVLDLIGDLSLVGGPLVGTVIAHKTSHNFNRLVVEHKLGNPGQWVMF